MRKLCLIFWCLLCSSLLYSQSYEPENLGVQVNSSFAERLPIISPDGKTLYFARKYHPHNLGEENQDDIWISERLSDGSWSKAVNIGAPLNTKDHNFVIAVSPSGNTLYLANDYKSMRKDGVSISHRKGRTWSNPQPLQIEDHYNRSDYVGYHVSVDGNTLLMSVEREEGYGERDLYVSFRTGKNRFSKPVNLGSTINTRGDETSVFLAADGKTIYFASNGRPSSIGGLDIYMSRRLDNSWRKWTTPKNLGPQINTPEHDFNFNIPASGEYAYFSNGPIQRSDLYRILLPEALRPEPVTLVSGRIIDKKSKQIVSGKLKVNDLSASKNAIETDAEGNYTVVVPYGKNVGIYAEQNGYFAVSENLKMSEENLEELDYMPDAAGVPSEKAEALQNKVNQLSQERKRIQEQRTRKSAHRHKALTQPSKSSFKDPEMEALRAKYNRIVSQESTPSNTAASSTPDDSNTFEDEDELARLRNQFNKANNQNSEEKVFNSRKILAEKEEDKELTALQQKFRNAYNDDNPATKAVSETDTEEGFEELEKIVRQELEIELLDDVKIELQQEMLPDVKADVAVELEEAEKEKLIHPAIDKTVKENYAAAVREELKKEMESLVKAELRTEWEEKIKNELRKALRDEVRTELRRQLRDEVTEELRVELQHEVKRSLEEELRAELEQLRQQESAVAVTPPSPPIEEEEEEEEEEPFAPTYREIQQDIVLIPIEVGQVIPMNNIFFDSNEASLKDASFSELERVLSFLKKNNQLVVEVGGHTNGWCSHVFAHELSDKRAKKVRDYFVENGIPANRIQHRGYGKTNPIASNDNAAGRRKNQRVELKILEIVE